MLPSALLGRKVHMHLSRGIQMNLNMAIFAAYHSDLATEVEVWNWT